MRWTRRSSWTVLLAPIAIGAMTIPAAAGTTSASHRQPITAVVVKSWSGCDDGDLWNELNTNWSSYGTIPISIVWNDPDLCGRSFTLAGLESSGADVVILDDPSGYNRRFTRGEVTALRTYAEEGHDLLGAFLIFSGGNQALAPLFGLVEARGWTTAEAVDRTYTFDPTKKAALPLMQRLPNPYVSSGYEHSQLPGDGVWSSNELAGAKIVAVNADRRAVITVYRQPLYNAVYVANMPPYGGGEQDQQFMYNAIIYPKMG